MALSAFADEMALNLSQDHRSDGTSVDVLENIQMTVSNILSRRQRIMRARPAIPGLQGSGTP